MSLEEIMAEKVRAMSMRKKSGDAYDIWYLLNKGVVMNREMIQIKLDIYDLKLDNSLFDDAFAKIEKSGPWH